MVIALMAQAIEAMHEFNTLSFSFSSILSHNIKNVFKFLTLRTIPRLRALYPGLHSSY